VEHRRFLKGDIQSRFATGMVQNPRSSANYALLCCSGELFLTLPTSFETSNASISCGANPSHRTHAGFFNTHPCYHSLQVILLESRLRKTVLHGRVIAFGAD